MIVKLTLTEHEVGFGSFFLKNKYKGDWHQLLFKLSSQEVGPYKTLFCNLSHHTQNRKKKKLVRLGQTDF
jgi:hypothetical protein